MIRSYGPGKFFKLIDSYVYETTLDGGADEEISLDNGNGWYGFLELSSGTIDAIKRIAAEHDDELTEDELRLLDQSEAVIIYERSDGIVEADWYDDAGDAGDDWDDIQDEFGGDDDEGDD